jgi:hypothetical protein
MNGSYCFGNSSNCFVTAFPLPEPPYFPLITRFVVFWLFGGSHMTHALCQVAHFFLIILHQDAIQVPHLPSYYHHICLHRYPTSLHHHIMSSLDGKPELARARPLTQGSVDTHTAEASSSRCDADSRMTEERCSQTPSNTQDDDIGLPLQSVPSAINEHPRRPRSPLRRRDGGFSLSDTVAARAYQRSMLNAPGETHDVTASNHLSKPSGAGSTRRYKHSHSTQTSGRPQYPFPTIPAGRGESGVSRWSTQTRDQVDPTEVTPIMVKNLLTGRLKEKDLLKIKRNVCRSMFGGDP